MTTNNPNHKGIWLLDMTSMALTWIGELPLPRPTIRERITLAKLYILSRGNEPGFIDWIKRLAKAVAFCLKPSQVAWSGKPTLTTGQSIEEEWAKKN